MRRKALFDLCSFVFAVGAMIFSHSLSAKTYGYVEKVVVENKITLPAKLDTGAMSASIGVQDIKISRNQKGKSMVTFSITDNGEDISFTKPLVKYVSIKMRSGESSSGYMKRPAVKLLFTFDGQTKEIVVNLTNRDRFNYPVLFGRNALKAFNIRIDPSKSYTFKLGKPS